MGQLTLDIVANVGGFEDGMTKAERVADKKLRAIEFAAKQRTKAIEDAFSNMASSIAAPIAAAFSVAAVTGFVQHIRTAAVEVDRFAKMAGSNAQEFQKYAYGATKAGLETDKFAGIMKDVNERFGEFAATGGGEMKDFFEKVAPKVGVTAEAFRNLSGPQALGLYHSTLQKANLSHAETTFYMEALASDASLLVPLLRDNAKGFKEAGEEAERLGLVMNDTLLAATAELDRNVKQLNAVSQGLGVTLGNAVIPTVSAMAGEILRASQEAEGFAGIADGLNSALVGVFNTALGAATAFKLTGTAIGGVAAAAAAVASGELGQAKDIISMLVDDLDRIALSAAASMERVGKAGETIRPLAVAVTATTPTLTPLNQALEKTGKRAKQAGDAIGDLIEKLEAKELEEAAKAVDAYNDAWATHLDTLWDQAEALENQVKLFGKSDAQLARLSLARAEERLQVAKSTGVEKAYIEALEQEVVQRRRIAEASRGMESLEANQAAAEQAQRDWEDTSKFIEQSIYDAIVSGGEDAGDVLKRTFKALVLEPMIRTVAQSAAGTVTNAFGMNGPSNGPGFGSLQQYNLSSGGSYISAFGNVTGSATMSAYGSGMTMTSAEATAAANAYNAAGYTDIGSSINAGNSMGSTLNTAGTYMSYANALYAATEGQWARAIGTAVGTYFGGPVGGWVGGEVGGWVDKTAAGGAGTPHAGAAVFGGPDGVKQPKSWEETQAIYADPLDANGFGAKDFYRRRQQGTADALAPLAEGAAGMLNGILADFGQEARYQVGMAFSADGTDKSRGRLSILDNAGDEVNEFVRKFSKDAQKGFADFAADVAPELRDALVAADLPGWADNILTSLGDKPSMQALDAAARAMGAIKDAAKVAGPELGLTAETIAKLVDQSGTWEGVVAGLNTVLAASIDESERFGLAQKSLQEQFAKLGVAMPGSTDAFVSLLSGIDATTDAGATLYNGLLNIAPAFLSVAGAVEQTFASISKTTAASVRDIEMSILDDAGKYDYLDNEIESLLTQLNESFDPATVQGLFEQINSKTMQAFNLLDADGQKAKATGFINRLYEAEARAQARLSVAPLPSVEASAESTVAAQKQAAVDLSAAVKQLGTLLSELSGDVSGLGMASMQLQNASASLAGISRALDSEVG
ncbi:hypothetical protein [Aromatoleum aromaticum]|uniref:hypothetical protein n=1 Tax=Aromatoleum aromaticum TaxID=551760 RepID=UPI0002F92260|nr:hypothetical protein [Aromatoleum aromaticum]NMG53902.1 hypothetical protein [Aromatoleum aromaticum]